MIPVDPSSEEVRRLEILRQYGVLDTPPEEALDELAALAAQICAAPIALISVVDDHRQWFKARVGLQTPETPREVSFCAHALQQTQLFIVPDATADERFAQNPLVTGKPHIRFYAGAPLVTPEGFVLGTLCVIDHVPRTLTAAQEHALQVLSRQAMSQLELRRQGRELRASEAKLRAIFEAEPECVKLLGADGTLHEINAAGLRLIEADHLEMVDGRSLLPIVVPEDRAAVSALLGAVAGGERRTLQFQIVGLKGTPRWLEMTAVPFHSGEPGGDLALGVSLDVTARKEAEEKIKRLNRLYAVSSAINEAIARRCEPRKLYEQACRIAVEQGGLVMAWVGLAEPDGLTLKPVARWGRDEGYLDTVRIATTTDEPTGRGPAGEAFRTGAPAYCRDIATDTGSFATKAEALQRGYGCCAASPIKPEGRVIGVLVVYGNRPGYFDTEDLHLLHALAENISFAVEAHRKEEQRACAERALLESEERFRLLSKATNDAIWDWDLLTDGMWWNEGFEALFGYRREEVEKSSESWKNRIHPETREQVVASIYRVIHEGEEYWEAEYRFRCADGSFADVLDRGYVIRDAGGQAVRMIGGMNDQTERKKLEQQFLRAQRMEGIGTLAGGIAHDLNNVLGPIIMALDLLKMRSADEASNELIDIIGTSAHRGADMVRQVLSFARGVEGRRLEIQVPQLLQDIEKITNDTFLKNIEIRTVTPAGLWTVVGDPTQLHQVLLNLCVNARDAMPNGGTLTLCAENITLDAHYAGMNLEAKPGPYVLLQIEDGGMGMPAEMIEKIFDPFFTTKETGKGTGLGLSTSLAIVKSHGGFIQVYSEVGKGTKFKVYLPAQTESSGETFAAADAELPRGHGELILVVDDEASVRQVTQQTLEAFGYRAMVAKEGAEAVALYAQHRPEIAAVLTDMMMPVMDGLTTIQVLRRMNPKLPIIAASGLSLNGPVALAASLGVKHFLPKPYTAETLLKILRQVLAEEPPGC